MKAVVAPFNQEKALVGAFSVLTNLWMELFQALVCTSVTRGRGGGGPNLHNCHKYRARTEHKEVARQSWENAGVLGNGHVGTLQYFPIHPERL